MLWFLWGKTCEVDCNSFAIVLSSWSPHQSAQLISIWSFILIVWLVHLWLAQYSMVIVQSKIGLVPIKCVSRKAGVWCGRPEDVMQAKSLLRVFVSIRNCSGWQRAERFASLDEKVEECWLAWKQCFGPSGWPVSKCVPSLWSEVVCAAVR